MRAAVALCFKARGNLCGRGMTEREVRHQLASWLRPDRRAVVSSLGASRA
jgi:hypothetical protein